jgi:hypothetical protein
MALRAKKIETRSWYTAYRGELVIHAAKGFPGWAKELCAESPFCDALNHQPAAELPLSRGLCVVRLVACVPTTALHKIEAALGHKPHVRELEFGDYADGRFAWVTEYVRPLEDIGPVRGALGLWNWPGVQR